MIFEVGRRVDHKGNVVRVSDLHRWPHRLRPTFSFYLVKSTTIRRPSGHSNLYQLARRLARSCWLGCRLLRDFQISSGPP